MSSQEDRDNGEKSWAEKIASKLTEKLWNTKPEDHVNDRPNSNLGSSRKQSKEDIEAAKLYMLEKETRDNMRELDLKPTWSGGYRDSHGNEYDKYGQPK